MLRKFSYVMGAFVLFLAAPAHAAVQVGQPAPDFEVVDVNGNTFKLSDHADKTVVLEWTNHQCPYVIKHYDSGNMQKTQKRAAEKGVAWVSIVSSAEGRQGNVSATEAKQIIKDSGATVTTKILDPSGSVGKLYDAKTTPHMFIIDKGTLVYAGAIDDNSSPRASAVKGAKNYVLAAIDDLAAGKAVQTAQTQPYGCSVKYSY